MNFAHNESRYGVRGCCQVCKRRHDNSGSQRAIGCGTSKYPDRLCDINQCSVCEYLFEYDDERTAERINGDVHFDLEAICVFYGNLNYANAKTDLRRRRNGRPLHHI